MIFDRIQQEILLPLVLHAADSAADKILDIHAHPEKLIVETKWDGSDVTNADHISHEVIETILAPHITGAILVSEENNIQVPESGAPHFLIDPLDGTSRFIKSIEKGEGERGFINVALVEEGVPRLAVIYNLNNREVFVTHEGIGSFVIPSLDEAWANANKTAVSYETAETLKIRTPYLLSDRLNVCFNAKGRTDQRYNGIRDNVAQKLELPPSHAIEDTLVGMRMLLRGKIDVSIRSNSLWESGYPHDIAPWWLLNKNAGGEMVFLGDKATTAADFSNRNQRMHGFMAMHRNTARPFEGQP